MKKRACSRKMWAGRTSAPLLMALLWLMLGVACRGGHDSLQLGGETNWLAWCESDAECSNGECVCGVCTTRCSAEDTGCASGPPGSECFANGSFGHAALCRDDGSRGICLPVCATSAECAEGTSCAAGACLPSAVEGPGTGLGPTGSNESDEARLASLQFSQVWMEDSFGDPLPLPPYSLGTTGCAAGAPCPTLEQVLSDDVCYDVRSGCGLLFVGINTSIGGSSYWYDGFGLPPVATYNWSDVGGSGVITSRSLDCGVVDAMCSSCGRDAPRCEELGIFPEPLPPAPVPGCSCEQDGGGGARVSLECFCGLYGCPAYTQLVRTCTEGVGGDVSPTSASVDACGQLWLSTGSFVGQRFAFDGETGALVGATASRDAPVASPCNTYRVSAGAAGDCAEVSRCDCSDNSTSREACLNAEWLDP